MRAAALGCIFFAVLLGGSCFPNDQFSSNRFSEVDFLLKSTSRRDLKEALNTLESLKSEEKNNWEYLLRLAEANWKLALNGRSEISYDDKKEFYTKAHNYAEKAVNKHYNSPETQKWYAVTLGSMGDYLSLKQKVKNGQTFQKHIRKALKMTDTDAHLYHLYGRFCFEVSELSWLERGIASALFGSVPKSTKEEALSYFKKAENLDEDWGENNLYMAKCYINLKQYSKAARHLQTASHSSPRPVDSDGIYDEIQTLMRKYEGYL